MIVYRFGEALIKKIDVFFFYYPILGVHYVILLLKLICNSLPCFLHFGFQSIMNQLYDVMYEFNFSLPPDYALVIRALGSLEGTAKALDPNFQVVESAYPFVIARLLADPSPDMRKILRELLIYNDGSIRWNRLERLVWY